jgi:hypothetical protein
MTAERLVSGGTVMARAKPARTSAAFTKTPWSVHR